MYSPAQMMWFDRPILSIFGGHSAAFGEEARTGLRRLNERLKRLVNLNGPIDALVKRDEGFLYPCLFLPLEEFIGLPYVEGTFAGNNAS